MKKMIYFLFLFGLFYSCYSKSSEFPTKDLVVKINKLKHYRGDITVNDTIVFTGAYFKKQIVFTPEESILTEHIKYGDTLITGKSPKDSITLRKKGEDIVFYTWPLILNNNF